MQRKLRALAHGTAENQQAGHAGSGPKRVRIFQHLVLEHAEVQRAENTPDQQDADQETEVAKAIGDKRLLAGIRGGGFLEPEPDQQVAGNTHQLPENEHLEETDREHDAQHRERKEAEAGKEPRKTGILAHVTQRINMDRAGHSGDDQQHHQAQRIKAQPEIRPNISNQQAR